jgi:hypothetical protein
MSKLNLVVKTKPTAVFFRFIRVIFFYVNGGHFLISVYAQNLDKHPRFEGGELRIHVKYAFGQLYEEIMGEIGPINPGETVKVKLEDSNWGVVANGHALFLASVLDNDWNWVPLYDKDSKLLSLRENPYRNRNFEEYHVHTFHAFSLAEFFSLTAVGINTLAFLINIILTAYINRVNLTNQTLQVFTLPILLHAMFVGALWLLFVYVVYDHYGT